MLKRKIMDTLVHWKADPARLPLVVHGQRQVGKTTSVLEFARRNYETVYELNFMRVPPTFQRRDQDSHAQEGEERCLLCERPCR